MSTVPLDYATRHTLTLIEKKRVSHALSNADALALVKAIVPADATGPQDASATETFLQAIADVQKAQPQLSFVQASDQVQKSFPALYDGYLHESRFPHRPRPVTKPVDAAPTYAAVMKAVEERCIEAPGLTKDEAWQVLLKTVPEGSPAFQRLWRHYARYQVSDEAVRDRDAAADARR